MAVEGAEAVEEVEEDDLIVSSENLCKHRTALSGVLERGGLRAVNGVHCPGLSWQGFICIETTS